MSKRIYAPLNRRELLIASAGLAGATQSLAADSPSIPLNLDLPKDNLLAYLKMRAGIETGEYFFWFTGGLDLAATGAPITPIITVESLLLRQVEKLPGDVFHITDYEATLYRDPDSGELADYPAQPPDRTTA